MNKSLIDVVSDENFVEIVSNSVSVNEVASKLGFKHTPGKNSKNKIKKRISDLNLSLKEKEEIKSETIKFINSKLNTKDIGNIGAGSLIFECSKLGIILSEPKGDNSPYDFIIDLNNVLYKVQVKTITKFENNSSVFRLKTGYTTSNRNVTKRYTVDDVDLFYLYNAAIDEGYLIKSSQIQSNGIVQETFTLRSEYGKIYKNSNISKDYLFKKVIKEM